jgi:hypothetical protein
MSSPSAWSSSVADRVGASLIRHARHDPLRVAEAVDRGGRLAPVLQFCDPCGQLYTDLLALTTAVSQAALPARSRDFMLRATDARRLRPAGWRAFWLSLGSARDGLTRPLAIGLTTLGLAGLLVTAAPTLLPVAGSAAASPEVDRAMAPAGAGAYTPLTVGGAASAPPDVVQVDTASPEPAATVTLSVGLLAAGGGLFVARRIAARSRRVR